mmetsp:Transcript_10582/g.23338  ORF Transcript_10582/g.23338 Transcript_10582/m.23338 type:complete len:509 (-) Transcript_10582:153-1679(-)|eukprot:CAMPEP_0206454552 /NCGR_PEP_ID=MMETSP0324_2-20121206/21206_1 /ASSEMBLY_ACC=CAM_ASM_000836 /TAXON_ID=2866 /ORGANISM="Crypthecodinium cohnii, Strain Seligo" /LENGTH=508 /DNA_ID=CAMNT_0053925049 /DNA_START=255 /DNA_END=1781 /DNA_ORIENTATION=+
MTEATTTATDDADASGRGPHQGKTALVLSALGLMVDIYDVGVINLVRPNLEAEFGVFSPGQDAAVTGASLFGAMVGQIFFGCVADYWGRKPIFVATASLIGIFAFLTALARPVLGFPVSTWLVVTRFFMGFGIGGEYPLSAANTIENVSPQQAAQAFAVVTVGMASGFIFGPLVLLLLDTVLGLSSEMVWRGSFGVGSAVGIVLAFCRFFLLEETDAFSRATAAGSGSESSSLQLVREPSGSGGAAADAKQGHAAALWHMRWSLIGTAGSWFLYDIATYGVGLFSTEIFPTEPGHDTAIVLLKINSFSLFGNMVAIWLSSRVPLRQIQACGLLAMAACFLVLYHQHRSLGIPVGVQSTWPLLVFGLMRAFDNGGPGFTTFAIPGAIFPTQLRGTAHGLSAACGKLGAILGAVAFPLLNSEWSMRGIMLFMALICICTALWTLIFVPASTIQQLVKINQVEANVACLEEQAIVAERVLFADDPVTFDKSECDPFMLDFGKSISNGGRYT